MFISSLMLSAYSNKRGSYTTLYRCIIYTAELVALETIDTYSTASASKPQALCIIISMADKHNQTSTSSKTQSFVMTKG